MAHPEGETLNELFATLSEWNQLLSDVPPEIWAAPDDDPAP